MTVCRAAAPRTLAMVWGSTWGPLSVHSSGALKPSERAGLVSATPPSEVYAPIPLVTGVVSRPVAGLDMNTFWPRSFSKGDIAPLA